MKHDYLWDRSGEPDPEIERLEQVLGMLRHRAMPLAMPPVPHRPAAVEDHTTWRGRAMLLALAAALVFLVRGTWPGAPTSSSAWTVELAKVSGSQSASHVRAGSALKANEWIVTDATSRARLRSEDVGVVEVEPESRVRLVSSRDGEHRLALSRGVLHAQIWATPGQFYVETPSATAIDLGCAYTLEVDEAGTARIRVTSGWVGLAHGRRESFVPAGAVCATGPDGTPGTPRLEDVTPEFEHALDVLDGRGGPVHANALDVVLDAARPQDAFSLWHLLARLSGPSASRVYDRLVVLAPPPPKVTRDRVLARDRAALDAWWDSLGLGDTRWYRTYRAER